MIRSAAILVLVAGTAQAADRPAPEYFVRGVMETSTAQQLALACPDISINLPVVSAASGEILARLQQDGFDPALDTLGMIDPVDRIAELQQAFLDKHDLAGAGTDRVCASARAEIAEGTVIGGYLIEVAQ